MFEKTSFPPPLIIYIGIQGFVWGRGNKLLNDWKGKVFGNWQGTQLFLRYVANIGLYRILGGGFKHFLFWPLGEMIQFDWIFFRWVGSTTKLNWYALVRAVGILPPRVERYQSIDQNPGCFLWIMLHRDFNKPIIIRISINQSVKWNATRRGHLVL